MTSPIHFRDPVDGTAIMVCDGPRVAELFFEICVRNWMTVREVYPMARLAVLGPDDALISRATQASDARSRSSKTAVAARRGVSDLGTVARLPSPVRGVQRGGEASKDRKVFG